MEQPERQHGRAGAWSLCGFAALAVLGTLLPWVHWGAWGMAGLAGDGSLVAVAAVVVAGLAARLLLRRRPPGLKAVVLVVLAGALASVVSLADLVHLFGLALTDAGAGALTATGALVQGSADLVRGAALFPWEAFLFGLTWGEHVPGLATAPAELLAGAAEAGQALEGFLRPGWGLVLSCLGSLGMLGTALVSLLSRK